MASTTVQGTVNRVFASKGFSLREEWSGRDGGTFKRFWSVFVPDGQPVTVAEGEAVKVTGMLQTEVSKSNPIYVDHKVSNATIERSGNAPVPPTTEHPDPRDDTPPEDPWAERGWPVTPIPNDETTPF
jgi:hypothetical protein